MSPPRPTRRRPSPRLPLPTSISLHNCFPVLGTPTPARPEHHRRLLDEVRLELIVDHKILHQQSLSGSVCPTWKHLEESSTLDQLTVEQYESLQARFFSAPCTVPFLQVRLHPRHMARIAQRPSELPLNAVVTEYTDGSLRVPPGVFTLLLESKLLQETHEHHESRFEDTVFSTLDAVTPEEELVDNFLSEDEESVEPVPPVEDPEPLAQVVAVSDPTERDDERRRLQQLLSEEQRALEQAWEELQGRKSTIQAAWKLVEQRRQQTAQVASAMEQVRKNQGKAAFLLAAQQIRLFRELRTIYPVTVQTDQRYRIRGLEIPADVLTSTVGDEELSAALGYLCHLVAMMSKYLGVELRHRLLPHGSRSTVEDGAEYPLYLARNVERERFEYAVHLLSRNVECLCKERSIRVSTKLHILAKVKRIYESVIDGY